MPQVHITQHAITAQDSPIHTATASSIVITGIAPLLDNRNVTQLRATGGRKREFSTVVMGRMLVVAVVGLMVVVVPTVVVTMVVVMLLVPPATVLANNYLVLYRNRLHIGTLFNQNSWNLSYVHTYLSRHTHADYIILHYLFIPKPSFHILTSKLTGWDGGSAAEGSDDGDGVVEETAVTPPETPSSPREVLPWWAPVR